MLRHAELQGASGTLILPWWPSAPFWPLPNTGYNVAPFVRGGIQQKCACVREVRRLLLGSSQVLAFRMFLGDTGICAGWLLVEPQCVLWPLGHWVVRGHWAAVCYGYWAAV